MFQKPSPQIALAQEENYAANTYSHDEVETVVGPSVHVEGDFASEGNILVKGTVSGSVKTSKLLTVEPGARIIANVRAGNAVIAGEIKGNVKVLERLEVTSTARILGDIECAVLVVEAGALLHGKVAMDGIEMDGAKAEKKRVVRGRIKEDFEVSSEEEENQ
jgi:cytoskeletal protein CcmA (bactofilin family)